MAGANVEYSKNLGLLWQLNIHFDPSVHMNGSPKKALHSPVFLVFFFVGFLLAMVHGVFFACFLGGCLLPLSPLVCDLETRQCGEVSFGPPPLCNRLNQPGGWVRREPVNQGSQTRGWCSSLFSPQSSGHNTVFTIFLQYAFVRFGSGKKPSNFPLSHVSIPTLALRGKTEIKSNTQIQVTNHFISFLCKCPSFFDSTFHNKKIPWPSSSFPKKRQITGFFNTYKSCVCLWRSLWWRSKSHWVPNPLLGPHNRTFKGKIVLVGLGILKKKIRTSKKTDLGKCGPQKIGTSEKYRPQKTRISENTDLREKGSDFLRCVFSEVRILQGPYFPEVPILVTGCRNRQVPGKLCLEKIQIFPLCEMPPRISPFAPFWAGSGVQWSVRAGGIQSKKKDCWFLFVSTLPPFCVTSVNLDIYHRDFITFHCLRIHWYLHKNIVFW